MGIAEHTLPVESRDGAKKPSVLRNEGKIPAIVYGKGIDPTPLSIDATLLNKIYHQAGESALVSLQLEGAEEKITLIKEPQFNPRTGELTHVDFYEVNLKEKIKAEVPLTFEGEAPALTAYEAILVTNRDHVEVECLPRDLPHELHIDISGLTEIDHAIHVKDIKTAEGVEILDDAEEIVVIVAAQKEEVEEEPVSEADAIASVEVATEKPEDGEAAAE